MKHHFQIIKNPLATRPGDFDHYEVRTVRDWLHPGDDTHYTEPTECEEDCDPEAEGSIGDVYFGVYGHVNLEGVEHIFDRVTLESALETLARMGIYP